MKLGISNIAWQAKDRLKYYELLKREKFIGLEIAPKIFLYNHRNFLKPSKSKIKKNLNEIKKYNLQLISMQSLLYQSKDCHLFLNSKFRKNFENRIIEIIKLAGKLNIPNLVFGSPKNRIIPNGMPYAVAEKIALKIFRKLGKEAKKNNTVLSIETNPIEYGTNFLTNIYQTNRFVKKVNSQNIKMILDTGELIINKELNQIENILKKYLKYINHIHISQPYLKSAKNFKHLSKVLKFLKKSKYNNWVSIEMRNQKKNNYQKVKNSIKSLRKIVNLI
mgnify:FL=1